MVNYKLLIGHTLEKLKELEDNSVDVCVTSPPYFNMRDYHTEPVHFPELTYCPMPGILFPIEVPEMTCELGNESELIYYIGHLVLIFDEVKRVLKDTGTFWLNIGDGFAADRSYQVSPTIRKDLEFGSSNPYGLKPKDLTGVPWRIAFALQARGWWLRMDNIWWKPNAMPESVKDRPTKAHEYVFLFSKSERYYYDAESISTPIKQESIDRLDRGVSESYKNAHGAPGQSTQSINKPRDNIKGNMSERGITRTTEGLNLKTSTEKNKRGWANRKSVWTIYPDGYKGAHFAVYPREIPEIAVLAGSPEFGIVLDPFTGSGTTGVVAMENRRNFIGIELNEQYVKDHIRPRLNSVQVAAF